MRRRETLREERGSAYSLRAVAKRACVSPGYLSQVEQGQTSSSSRPFLERMACLLELDPDVVLAAGGHISSDLLEIIISRPRLMAQVLRQIKHLPDTAIVQVVRTVTDGDW